MTQITQHKRHTRWLDLSETLHGKNAYIQITEWVNGEGWDVEISTSLGHQHIALDYDVIDCLNHLLTAKREA